MMNENNSVNKINSDQITVWWNGSGMLVHKEVADQLNLSPGHRIKDQQEFWDILAQNASLGIAKCAIQRAGNGWLE